MATSAIPPHASRLHAKRPNNLSSSSTFQRRANHLHNLISAPEEPYTRARWRRWLDNSMLLTLESNFHKVQQQIGSVLTLTGRPPTTNADRHWKRTRRKFQSTVYAALHKQQAPDTHTRFAHKLDRWKLHSTTHLFHDHLSVLQRTPNWQARCAHHRLQTIAKLTSPRVHAAVFGAIWNRWCTLRRFQLRGRCRLCQQPHTEDSIEHYSHCNAVCELATRHLNLCRHKHVNIHTFTCTNALIRTTEQLTRAALLLYATYRASNHQRHTNNSLHDQDLYHAMCQWVVEGACGHAHM